MIEGKFSDQSRRRTRIVFFDLPGERFADCLMLGVNYRVWSLKRIEQLEAIGHKPKEVVAFLEIVSRSEVTESELVASYKAAQVACVARHHHYVSPSTLVLDDEGRQIGKEYLRELRDGHYAKIAQQCVAGLPGREFAPLANVNKVPDLARQMERNYNAYRRSLIHDTLGFLHRCQAVAVLFDVSEILRGGPDLLDDACHLLKAIGLAIHPDPTWKSTLLSLASAGFWKASSVRRLAVVASQIDRFHEKDWKAVTSLLQDFARRPLQRLRNRIRVEYCNVSAVKCAQSSPESEDMLLVYGGAGSKKGTVTTTRCPVLRIPRSWGEDDQWEWPADEEWNPDEVFPSPPGFPRFATPSLPKTRTALPRHIQLDRLARFLLGLED